MIIYNLSTKIFITKYKTNKIPKILKIPKIPKINKSDKSDDVIYKSFNKIKI